MFRRACAKVFVRFFCVFCFFFDHDFSLSNFFFLTTSCVRSHSLNMVMLLSDFSTQEFDCFCNLPKGAHSFSVNLLAQTFAIANVWWMINRKKTFCLLVCEFKNGVTDEIFCRAYFIIEKSFFLNFGFFVPAIFLKLASF